jgi:hypothetical protein
MNFDLVETGNYNYKDEIRTRNITSQADTF